MKLRCHVLSAQDNGDVLLLKLQGQHQGSSVYSDWFSVEMGIPITDTSRKSYYVGRHCTVEISPIK